MHSVNNTVYYRKHKNWSVGKKIGQENSKSGRLSPSGGPSGKGRGGGGVGGENQEIPTRSLDITCMHAVYIHLICFTI